MRFVVSIVTKIHLEKSSWPTHTHVRNAVRPWCKTKKRFESLFRKLVHTLASSKWMGSGVRFYDTIARYRTWQRYSISKWIQCLHWRTTSNMSRHIVHCSCVFLSTKFCQFSVNILFSWQKQTEKKTKRCKCLRKEAILKVCVTTIQLHGVHCPPTHLQFQPFFFAHSNDDYRNELQKQIHTLNHSCDTCLICGSRFKIKTKNQKKKKTIAPHTIIVKQFFFDVARVDHLKKNI